MIFWKRIKENLIYIAGLAFALLIGAIYVFTNVSYDSEYQIAMGYRMIRGDRMLVDMWEPHQTSAFLVAFLEWIFIRITETTTGIVLYLQSVSTIIRGLIAFALYKSLEEGIGKKVSASVALLFFVILPKDIAIADFSNMQVWFGTLLFICFIEYYKTEKMLWVFLSAVCLCLQVISYPSCALVLLPSVAVLYLCSGRKKKTVFLYIGTCIVIGLIYAGYFVCKLGIEGIFQTLSMALSLEPTHTISAGAKILNYLIGMGKLLLPLLTAFLLGWIGERLTSKVRKGQIESKDFILLIMGVSLLVYYFYVIFFTENRHGGSVLYVFLLALGVMNVSALDDMKRKIYISAIAVSLGGLLATLILADGPIETSIPYALLAVSISILPISEKIKKEENLKKEKAYLLLFLIFLSLFFARTVYLRIPLTGRGQIMTISEKMSIIKDGPATGIITDYLGTCKQRDSYNEWCEFVSADDRIMIIGGDVVDTLGYLYTNSDVAVPSVMSTPTYNDSLLEYWKLHPEKCPDVFAVSSYKGELDWSVKADKWVMNWLENEYNPRKIKEGTWWTFYYIE